MLAVLAAAHLNGVVAQRDAQKVKLDVALPFGGVAVGTAAPIAVILGPAAHSDRSRPHMCSESARIVAPLGRSNTYGRHAASDLAEYIAEYAEY